ncbi:MAG: transposase [Rhodobacteraceae bacterium]|nr:transposase [Paracoccaceae bacterium]
MVALESLDINRRGEAKRPPKDSVAMVRAFVAKATWGMKTTREVLDRLMFDLSLRRMCAWVFRREVPSEATFSRAFAEFAVTEVPARVHENKVRQVHGSRLAGHASRDATAIEGRERSGERRKASLPGRQAKQRPSKMLAELPQDCNVGRKANAKG